LRRPAGAFGHGEPGRARDVCRVLCRLAGSIEPGSRKARVSSAKQPFPRRRAAPAAPDGPQQELAVQPGSWSQAVEEDAIPLGKAVAEPAHTEANLGGGNRASGPACTGAGS